MSAGVTSLAPARERGAEVFSLHPLQTLPDGGADPSHPEAVVVQLARHADAGYPEAVEFGRRHGVDLPMG